MVENWLSKVKLRFALQDGIQVSIRDFDGYRGTESDRPSNIVCPQCNEEVCPVLPTKEDEATGKRIADHFRHLPDATCSVREGGESAAHLNAKAFLTQKLNDFHSISLVYKCNKCSFWYSYLKIEDYDHAEPEWKVGRRRPDIACLSSAGVILGAVEIYHSHRVSDEKKAEFTAQGLTWFEISAGRILTAKHFLDVEGPYVFSIDATGADVTYPPPPSICEECQYESASEWERMGMRKAPIYEWGPIAYRNLDLGNGRHRIHCDAEIKRGDGFVYCGTCGHYLEDRAVLFGPWSYAYEDIHQFHPYPY